MFRFPSLSYLFAALAAAVGGTGETWAGERDAYAVRRFDVQDGLPDLDTQALCQTKDGFLWIGTASGLARFDGLEFTLLRSPLIARESIRCLETDAEGTLWIGTQSGVCRLRGNTIDKPVPIETAVMALMMDNEHRLWIGTRSQGLWRFENGKLVDCSGGLRGSAELLVRTIYQDRSNRIWIGLGNGGPAYLDGDRIVRLSELPTGPPGVARFAEYPEGTLWFTCGPAVYRWRDGVLTRFGKEEGLSGEPVWGIAVDHDGQIWAAARTVARLRFPDATKFEPVDIPDLDLCRTVTVDRENGCWIGTSAFGIARLSRTAFSTATFPELGSLKPITMGFALDGTVFAATPAGLFRLGGSESVTALDHTPPAEDSPRAMCCTKAGRLWVARRSALEVWTGSERVSYREYPNVQALFEDRLGAVWIGAGENVWRFRDGTFERMNEALGLREHLPVATFADADDAFYVGLRRGGLLRWANGRADFFRADAESPLDGIRTLQADRDGYVWVGTRGAGLAVFRDGKVLSPPALSHGFLDFVTAVELDDDGHLFVGTPAGLFWANRREALATALGSAPASPFVAIGAADGVATATVGFGAYPASGRCPDGRLWFATRAGVVFADPARLVRTPPSPPPVHILAVEADGRSLAHSGPVTIPANAGGFRIDYTAPAFNRPELIRFRYRMAGYDTEWVDVGTRRTAYYGRLTPGLHRFELEAAAAGGPWAAEPINLVMDQQPRLYQTLWFQFFVGVAIAGCGALIALALYRSRIKRRLAVLESERRVSRERERIARDLHDELGSTVTKIGYWIERLEQQRSDTDARHIQEGLSSQTKKLALDLDRVVWSIRPANPSLHALAEFIERFVRSFFRGTPMTAEVRFEAQIPELPISPDVQHNVLAVAKEALNNSLKHAHATNAVVTLGYGAGVFTMTIADNGCGFDVEDCRHAERNGLSNMRSRIDEVAGTFTISSRVGSGTHVYVAVPVGVPIVARPAR